MAAIATVNAVTLKRIRRCGVQSVRATIGLILWFIFVGLAYPLVMGGSSMMYESSTLSYHRCCGILCCVHLQRYAWVGLLWHRDYGVCGTVGTTLDSAIHDDVHVCVVESCCLGQTIGCIYRPINVGGGIISESSLANNVNHPGES